MNRANIKWVKINSRTYKASMDYIVRLILTLILILLSFDSFCSKRFRRNRYCPKVSLSKRLQKRLPRIRKLIFWLNSVPGPLIILGSLVFNIFPICRAINVLPVPEKNNTLNLSILEHVMERHFFALICKSVDKILCCYLSNEIFLAELFRATIYFFWFYKRKCEISSKPVFFGPVFKASFP